MRKRDKQTEPRPTGVILTLDEVIRRTIMDALAKCNGNKSQAAELLGIGRATIYVYLDKWHITKPLTQAEALRDVNR